MNDRPAYVTHPKLALSRRIHVDGYHDSDYTLAVAMLQFPDGQVGLAVDGCEPSFENLIEVHRLLTIMVNKVDERIQQHASTTIGDN